MPIAMLILSLCLGFTVATGTAIFLPYEKVARLPIGSISAAFGVGYCTTDSFLLAIICGAWGLVGGALYLEIAKKLTNGGNKE